MTYNTNAILEQLAAASLEKCLARLARVSAGTWKLLGVKAAPGTVAAAIKRQDFRNPLAAVYFAIGTDTALTTMMLFKPEDMECVSKCFTGHSFPRSGGRTTPAEEIMLLELGNIVMNSMANSVLNALKKSSMPAVPQFVEGNAVGLEEALVTVTDLHRDLRVVQATLELKCDKKVTHSEVFAFVPVETVVELEQTSLLG